MIKVSILDDQLIVLNGVEQMLHQQPGIALIGSYRSRTELLEGFGQEMPDVLLLDIRMQEEDGDAVATYLTKHYPDIRILALTNFDTLHFVKKMLRSGVHGYLLKDTDRDTLIHAIETVYGGDQYLQPSIQEQMLHEFSPQARRAQKTPTLTKRETEILNLIVKQHSSQEIADKLFLSLRTVENHRYNLFQKMDVKNVAGLIAKSYELGLIS